MLVNTSSIHSVFCFIWRKIWRRICSTIFVRYCLKESGRQKRKSRERCPHRPADLPEDSNFLGQPCQNRPAKFARTSLSAWGLPTPAVAFACIGNVDIQVFSGVGGRLYFIRRLQVYLFIIFHVQPISQGVTLLFFFAEKKKEAKKEKSSRSTCTVRFQYHPKI